MGLWSFLIVNLVRPITQVLFAWMFAMRFYGLENIPHTGPVILTPNHVTYLDPILVSLAVRRRLFYMAWDELFAVPLLGGIMRLFGAFPLKLEGYDLSAIKRAYKHLRNAEALVIFPEGGRTTTGKLDPFKPGAFRLALQLGIPVVPVTIKGAYELWPPHQRLPKLRGEISIHYHPPIIITRADKMDMKTRMTEISHQVRFSIASALEPEFVPEDFKSLAPDAALK